MENNKESFKYTYSAKEQEEIKKIQQKYQMPEENGVDKLRKLDAKVNQKATSVSLVFGVLGTLIMGFGMSLIMTDLGSILEINNTASIVVGLATGFIGIILIASAYPVYKNVTQKEREKIAPEIRKLVEELLK